MNLQRYRAVQRKFRSKPQAEGHAELVRVIKAGHKANRLAYKSLRKSGLDQSLAEKILAAGHFRRNAAKANSLKD